MKGTLMDRKTGEMILDGENRNITASKKFKPKTAEGSVEVKLNLMQSLWPEKYYNI